MYIQPSRWLLDDALWAHYYGNDAKAMYLMVKLIKRVVKEPEHG